MINVGRFLYHDARPLDSKPSSRPERNALYVREIIRSELRANLAHLVTALDIVTFLLVFGIFNALVEIDSKKKVCVFLPGSSQQS
jgi:hypothetical protein